MNKIPPTTSYTVVVPAAGVGKRMGSELPKQYLLIDGKTILEHTITRLLSHARIANVVVSISKDDHLFSTLDIASNSNVNVVIGGKERSDSVLAGLEQVNTKDWVLVHDAARPCITHQDIDQLIATCETKHVGAILAYPVRDTMKRSDANLQINHTESRDNLWHAQTPQMFNNQQLQDAMQQAQTNNFIVTDEASAIEYVKQPCIIVSGREDNIKVTRPSDYNLAMFILSQQKESTCE